MSKSKLVWLAKSLNLDSSGTIPDLQRRIAIYNTKQDCLMMPDSEANTVQAMLAVASLRHQLAKRVSFDELFELTDNVTKNYYVEEKYDGMRAWLVMIGAEAFVFSRHYTKDLRLNSIANIKNIDLSGLPIHKDMSILDVELYVTDPSIARLEKLGLTIGAFAAHEERQFKVRPIILDAVLVSGMAIASRSNVERTEILHSKGYKPFMAERYQIDVRTCFEHIVYKQDGEGLVLKQKRSRYAFGERRGWLKLKAGYADGANEYDVLITGMGDRGTGRNTGLVGSVTICDLEGQPLGEVGTFTDAVRRELTDTTTGLLKVEYIGKKIEVRAMELTRENKLRHASFIRFL